MADHAEPERLVHLGLGANLGDRLSNLRAALASLGELGRVGAISSLYQTEPVGGVAQPAFFNAVCALWTSSALFALLEAVKRIEAQQGRRPGVRWGPRPLDIDILLAGTEVIATDTLSVPHEQLSERAFVLVPLAEIAPEALHPVVGCTVRELLDRLPGDDQDGVQRIRDPGWAV